VKKPRFQTPTGMHDVFGDEQAYFQKIARVVQSIAQFYNFQKIDTPIAESAELFSRGIGLSTDIVEKQMYLMRTKGGDLLALRPEGTAPIVRAYIQHGMWNLPQPVKLWYWGPFFRYEHPQAGRLRQFHQFGFEILGEENPAADAQIIFLSFLALRELKLKDIVVEVNSIGDSQCRPYYKKILVNYLRSRIQGFCADCRRRIRENPLRVLDCKEEKCQRMKIDVPQIVDHLCELCKAHFKEVLEFLDELQLPYRLNPFLVRGLDYYTKTVFEIYERKDNEEELSRQSALAGGGRFDGLGKMVGGKPLAACGGAAGVERIVGAMRARGVKPQSALSPRIFFAQLGTLAKRKSLGLIEEFRKAGIPIAESLGKDSLKTQLGRAHKMGVDWALILGQKEALEETIIVRQMASGKQEAVKLERVVEEMSRRLQSKIKYQKSK
jgi:histidyl-tRNA synthetase